MLRKKFKKAFTLVELVVVIAIIAILAGISVAVYVGITNKAKATADSEIVSQLNTQMRAKSVTEGSNKTAYDAYLDAKEIGFDLELMKPQTGGKYVWDEQNDLFACVKLENGNLGDVISQDKSKPFKAIPAKSWIFTNEVSKNVNCCQYMNKADTQKYPEVIYGFDGGENKNIEKVTFDRTQIEAAESQDVVIRTNSASTELVVNAEHDTVKHFDKVGTVHVIAVDPINCYEENGKAAFTQMDSGKYKTTETADVELLYVSDYNNVSVAVVPGTVDHAHASSSAAAAQINGTNPGVIFDYDENGEQVAEQCDKVFDHTTDSFGLTENFENNKNNPSVRSVIDEAILEELIETQKNCAHEFEEGVCTKCGYNDPNYDDSGYRVINHNTIVKQGKNLSDLWGYVLDDSIYSGSAITILKDYDKDLGNGKTYFTYYNNAQIISPIHREYTIDLNGMTIELAATPSWGIGDRLDRNAAYGGAGCINFAYAFGKTFIFNDSFGTGKIYNSSAYTETKNQKTAAVAISQDGGTFIFNGGTYQSNNYALYVEFGDITINGGNFIGDDSVYIFNCRTDSANYVKMTINGGTFDGDFSVNDLPNVGGVPVVTINGGKFTDVSVNNYLATGKAMVYDGSKYFEVVDASSVTAENYKGKINNKVYCSTADLALHFAQSGDTVEIFEDATQDKALGLNETLTVVANGHTVNIVPDDDGTITDDGNGNYSFVPEQHSPIEVTVGENTTGYTSFADFTISDGMSIKLYADIVLTAKINISNKGNVILDLNGHIITCPKIAANQYVKTDNCITLGQSGKTVTIKNGTIIYYGNSSNYALNIENTGKAVIENMNIITDAIALRAYSSSDVSVKGGIFVGKADSLKWSDSSAGNLVISNSDEMGIDFYGTILYPSNATKLKYNGDNLTSSNAGESGIVHTYADYTSTHTLQMNAAGMYRVVDGANATETDGWTNVEWWK